MTLRTLDGTISRIAPGAIEHLRTELVGHLLTPDSAEYDDARTVWNAAVDRRPGLIARCATTGDVSAAIRFARDHALVTAVRGGGHNIAGNAVCDSGIVIDLSPMKAIKVDASRRMARVQPGCTLGEFDAATQAQGLATPLGINSTTGIAGLTLGGGFGWLSRKHGMTIDNLLAVEIVTVEGRILQASEALNPDLFWGVRGGGGNFGVVTSFDLRLHPVGPEVLAGLIVHPLDDAPDVLRFYRDFTATLPDEAAVWVVLRKAPPLPFLPEEWHGREVVVLAAFHGGDLAEGERILRPLREFGKPIADVVGPAPYAAWQQAFDPLLTPGLRNYWKSHDFVELSDDLLDVLVTQAQALPSPHCEVILAQVGGAMNQIHTAETAYPHRDAEFIMNVHGRWESAADDSACIGWARNLAREAGRYATGGVYVNFMTEEEVDRVRAAYGVSYDRLVQLKGRYDPGNLLRMNQNIPPAGPGANQSGPGIQVPT